jgi:predicted dehydrogenase
MNNKSTSRRSFIKLAATGAVAAGVSRQVFALEPEPLPNTRYAPSDKIRLALIGAGGRGSDITTTALKVPGTELVAVSDVYQGRLIRAKEVWGNHLFTSRDYREVLSRSDIDAVIVATPDHWHSTVSKDAMKAGKDVYCEKPMVQLISDGPEVIETAKQTGRIFQVGSQRVSSIIYKKAKELLAAGAIGKLTLIEAYWDRNSAIGAWQYSIPPDASPETVDWDRFLGRAPKRPFEPVRLFRWRNYRDYGTGVAGDLFVHLFSGMHYVVDSKGPTRVMATGGLRYWKDGRDVPDVMLGLYDYPETSTHPAFNLSLKVNFEDGSGESSMFKYTGNEGVMVIGSSGVTLTQRPLEREPGYTIETFPEEIQKKYMEEYRKKYPSQSGTARLRGETETSFNVGRNYNDTQDHFVSLFNGMRTREQVVENATFGFRAAGPALLSNLSYFNNRIYEWDPENMKIKGEGKASSVAAN